MSSSISSSSSCSSVSSCLEIGLLARLPVGTMRSPGRVSLVLRPVEPKVFLGPVAREPEEMGTRLRLGGPVGASSTSSASSSSSSFLMGPLMAAVGPGKSSGTMGLPRTLESLGGGVDGERRGVVEEMGLAVEEGLRPRETGLELKLV